MAVHEQRHLDPPAPDEIVIGIGPARGENIANGCGEVFGQPNPGGPVRWRNERVTVVVPGIVNFGHPGGGDDIFVQTS